MNIYETLIDFYNRNAEKFNMLPLYHSTASAQITVTIDMVGNFKSAELVEDDDKVTCIQVTEKSSARTNNIAPHMLCDTLRYLAGDLEKYTMLKSDKTYLEQLEDWVYSKYSHPTVRAIYNYVKKGELIKDLVKTKVLQLDEEGQLDTKIKLNGVNQEKFFIRFLIEDAECPKCWQDKSLQDTYIAYSRSLNAEKGISYMTGNKDGITYLHPKKIRNDSDQTKLLSGNDTRGFTFRGRFTTQEEAYAVGTEDSQKVHNTLKWLIRKCGCKFNDLYIVVWQEDMELLPEWEKELCLQDTIWRGKNEDKLDSFTYLLAVDAATSGRLSIQEFSIIPTSQYIENIANWLKKCSWEYTSRKEEPCEKMVGVKEAAELLYGIEKNGHLSLTGKEDLYRVFVKRWMPCILEQKAIPKDFIERAVKRASSPETFKSFYVWWKEVCFACSLVKGSGGVKHMEQDRNYLYGRLLAVADHLENYVLYIRGMRRSTNARRYMRMFSQNPFRTWKIIEQKLAPYYKYLSPAKKRKYEKEFQTIMELFQQEEYQNNQALNGVYLMGYYEELKKLNKKGENTHE